MAVILATHAHVVADAEGAAAHQDAVAVQAVVVIANYYLIKVFLKINNILTS